MVLFSGSFFAADILLLDAHTTGKGKNLKLIQYFTVRPFLTSVTPLLYVNTNTLAICLVDILVKDRLCMSQKTVSLISWQRCNTCCPEKATASQPSLRSRSCIQWQQHNSAAASLFLTPAMPLSSSFLETGSHVLQADFKLLIWLKTGWLSCSDPSVFFIFWELKT